MKDFRFLKILDVFSFVYRMMGVDYGVMRKILQIKLLMDRRRVPGVLMGSQSKKREDTFIASLIIYGIMGLFAMFFIFPPLPLFLKMNFIMGIIIFMAMMVMVADFSTILLDIKDKAILLSKPINVKTINAAKITHIVMNLSAVIFVIAGPSLIAGLFLYGFLFSVILVCDLLVITGFVLFLTSLLYFLILLFFDGDKVKDIINYFQIIFSLVMMIGYQFVGRIFSFVDNNMVLAYKWWIYLLPSAWFAAPFSLIMENKTDHAVIYLSVMGLLVPILLTIIYFKVAIKYFEINLQKLGKTAARKGKLAESGAVIYKKLLSRIITNNYENIFCRFTQNMISSERNLKLRLYPNLGFAVFLPVIILVNNLIRNDSLSQALSYIEKGPYYLFIYMTVFSLAISTRMISSSEKYKGAWIYKALPIESPGVVLRGALAGYVLKYVIPVYLFVCLLFAVPYGIRLIPHVILMFHNMLLLIVLLFRLSPKELPFNRDFQNVQGARLWVVLGSLAFCGLSAVLHYTLRAVDVGLFIYIAAALLATAFLWKTGTRIAWKDVL
ncbi:MAG: hypothetical protein K6T65_04640 [Peptococcaceae bacterium]|nr:hypothetical protein [Peptococcaceae bacterium]